MRTNNPVNLRPVLDSQTQELTTEHNNTQQQLAQALIDILAKGDETQAELAQALADILARVTLENDQNQAILESITTVNGELDTNVQTINDHTDTKTAEVLAEIVRQDAGSLYKLLYDALNTRINTRATPADVTAASDNVKSEIVRTTAGSLYKLLYDALNTRINTRATPADVTAARDSVNNNVDAEGSSTRTTVNNARDNVKAEIVRTTAGSLYEKLAVWMTNNIKAEIQSKSPIASVQRGSVYDSVPSESSIDITISAVDLSKAHLSGQIASRYGSTDTETYLRYQLINSTTIRIWSSGWGNAVPISFSWEVIEYV